MKECFDGMIAVQMKQAGLILDRSKINVLKSWLVVLG
jgi:hypothetical protein